MTTSQLSPRQRHEAHWAHQVTRLQNWCMLDTETTSFGGEIIDIAIIGPDGAVLLNQLIRPTGEHISEDAKQVHGISEAMVADAPTFLQVWPQIYETLSKFQGIITYNADFDTKRLVHSAIVNGLRVHCCIGRSIVAPAGTQFIIPGLWSCLMKHYAEFWGEPGRSGCKWQSLTNACRQQGVEHSNWHRALGDCQAALKLLKAMAVQYVAPEQSEEVQP